MFVRVQHRVGGIGCVTAYTGTTAKKLLLWKSLLHKICPWDFVASATGPVRCSYLSLLASSVHAQGPIHSPASLQYLQAVCSQKNPKPFSTTPSGLVFTCLESSPGKGGKCLPSQPRPSECLHRAYLTALYIHSYQDMLIVGFFLGEKGSWPRTQRGH